ncbi:MAG: PEP-CTERM sorting domain-containing protein [bacterium]|nr:PEP-CTERM sorting domain-containing protein [bacterium]
MRQLPLKRLAAWTMMALIVTTAVGVANVWATPAVNSAVIQTRIWNDDSDSVLTFGDTYPANVYIQDAELDGDGAGGEFANLHNWRFSENNFTPATFNNADRFSFSADVVISGTGRGEASLQIAPWWSQDVDGRLNVRSTDGEIACFGGRLPFFSFTGTFGINYVHGDTISLGMDYKPNGLSAGDPGTIEYLVTYNSVDYTSGVIAFDEGNAAEGKGTWGMLDDARVGGHFQPYIDVGNSANNVRADWNNIVFVPEPASLALLLLGGMAVLRRVR